MNSTKYFSIYIVLAIIQTHRGAEEACRAHNPQVGRSKLPGVTHFSLFFFFFLKQTTTPLLSLCSQLVLTAVLVAYAVSPLLA
jgi:hypothetical protein